MNYPMQELAVVGPVLFIVLMIAFPVIGVFAGWKRAAYWGGGNFLFYVIGLIIWIFAHDAISSMVNNIITPLLQGTGIKTDITKIAASVAAPGFFIIVLLVGNLLLVINYFAWFKRVVKIGKFEKREQKEKKQKPHSLQYKLINGAIGGVGLPLLLLPTTLSFTQAVMFTTTSATTRANNSLAAGVYNGLAYISNGVSGFSYYGYTNTLQDIDALFSAINVATQEVTYIGIDGEPHQGTAVEGLKDVVGNGVTGIIDKTKAEGATLEQVQTMVTDVAKSWNSLLGEQSSSRTDITVMFNSENATELIQDMIGQNMTEKITIDPTIIGEGAAFGEGGIFDQTVEWYVTLPAEQQITPIQMNQGSYNNMCNMINNMFNLESLSQEQQQTFKARVDQLSDLFFEVK